MRLEIFTLLAVTFLISNAGAFGVGYTDFRCPDSPVKLFPGQEKIVELRMQNMVGDEDISINVELRNSEGIAEMKEKVYTVKAKTDNLPVHVNLKIPENADIGTKYNIGVAFDTVTSGDSGGVAIGTGMDVNICVEVVPEYIVEEPQLSPALSGTTMWIIAGVVIAILIGLVILLLRKRHK